MLSFILRTTLVNAAMLSSQTPMFFRGDVITGVGSTELPASIKYSDRTAALPLTFGSVEPMCAQTDKSIFTETPVGRTKFLNLDDSNSYDFKNLPTDAFSFASDTLSKVDSTLSHVINGVGSFLNTATQFPGADAQTFVGPEFRVNSITADVQATPRIAVLQSGDFVITWWSWVPVTASTGYSQIYAQRYSSSGVAQGGNFLVGDASKSQSIPDIVALPSGDFIISWQSWFEDGDDSGVYAKRFSAIGVAQGSQFRVNTYTTGAQAEQRMFLCCQGGFGITWSSNGQDGSGYGVYAQLYYSSGAPLGSEFRVNSLVTTGDQIYSQACSIWNGFVVTFLSGGTNSQTNLSIYARLYDYLGVSQGPEFLVKSGISNEYLSNTLAIAPLLAQSAQESDFIIMWSTGLYSEDVYIKRYSAMGLPQGAEFPLSATTSGKQDSPAASVLPSGDVLIAWTSCC